MDEKSDRGSAGEDGRALDAGGERALLLEPVAGCFRRVRADLEPRKFQRGKPQKCDVDDDAVKALEDCSRRASDLRCKARTYNWGRIAGRPLQGSISHGSWYGQRRDLRHRRQASRGNSAFAFVGSYSGEGESIQVRIATERHNDDPQFKPLFGSDRTLTLQGRDNGHMIDFEGTALQLPGVAFRATLTRIND
jgi:hypothetical protein